MRSPLSRYTLLAKRWAWVVLLGVVICSSMTYVVTKLMKPVYQASTLLILTVTTSNSTYDNTSAVLEALPTYSQLVKTPGVVDHVAPKYGLTSKQVEAMMTVKPQSNTQIIELDVENNSPQLAAALANDLAKSYAQFVNTQIGAIQVQVLPAAVPVDPTRPKPSQDALIGALVGLGLALAIIVIFEWLDDRTSSPEEIQEILGIEALTIIPSLSRQQRLKNAEETPALAEGCRILCSNLTMMQAQATQQQVKLIMVTSALAGEGKSTVAANLASFLAMAGKRVLLVDADLRHPVLDQHFQLSNHQGLSNAFLEMWAQIKVELEGQPTEIPSLRVLTSGVLPSNPSELLQSPLAKNLFDHFKTMSQFDYIIFDTPPLLPIADAQIIASYVDGILLIVDAPKTPRKMLARAKQTLGKTGTKVLGIAINKSSWLDYSDLSEYLGSSQQKRPKADIAMSMSGQMSPTNGTFDQSTNGNSPMNRFGSGPDPRQQKVGRR